MNTPNIILIDKPVGITSFDVIRILRRTIREKKIGHSGTLDPLASGLMLVAYGKGTKELSRLLRLPKSYEAEVTLGESRVSGDQEGKIVEEADASHLTEKEIAAALKTLVGKQTLPVPAFSAVKVNGTPLYKKARKGQVLDLPLRVMQIEKAKLLGVKQNGERLIARISFSVGSGTYIRTLAEELGRRLSVPASLYSLRRTSIGEYRIEDAQKLDI
jgi:tRNA pseudouridine55 synthase